MPKSLHTSRGALRAAKGQAGTAGDAGDHRGRLLGPLPQGHFRVWQSTKSTVAKAALDRIAQFYAIEDKARFAAPDERLAHRTDIIPLLDAFFTWAQTAERQLSARSELAQALRYIIKRRTALTRFATDARLEADNNIAENAIRCIALGRRNWLFAGSHSGGERAAA